MLELKSAILLIHIIGLALGLGGAFITDIFLSKYIVKKSITIEKFQFVEFASKIVCYGLALLWVSGLGFIAYYYFYSPEYLFNQKVWAKAFIVLVLTINGIFIHFYLLPILKGCIGSSVFVMASENVAYKITAIGIISALSWLFPLLLGVSKTLNFKVSVSSILSVYAVMIALSLSIGYCIVRYLLIRTSAKTMEEKIIQIHQQVDGDPSLIATHLFRLTGQWLTSTHINDVLNENFLTTKTVQSIPRPLSFEALKGRA